MSTVVPWRRLDSELLRSVIESFVNREGTDYGALEISLDEKVYQIKAQLERREAFIVFDGETESVTIVTAQQASLLRALLQDEGYDHGDEEEAGLAEGLEAVEDAEGDVDEPSKG